MWNINSKMFYLIAIALIAVGGPVSCGEPQKGKVKEIHMSSQSFPQNEFWRKGGVGAITDNIYVDLTSSQNKLLINKIPWEGLSNSQHQVVIINHGVVSVSSSVPSEFKLSESVIVSFEGMRVYFYDFGTMDGGYYSR